jgi:hypothetical protein
MLVYVVSRTLLRSLQSRHVSAALGNPSQVAADSADLQLT